MSNSPTVQKPKFSKALQTAAYQKVINDTLKEPKRASRFIASISSAVATNPNLQNCDAGTILSCALLGESLELSPSPQLGQYYLVPMGGKATFILGYKGYIQLAIRSGQYKKLNVVAIKRGELVKFDPVNEEIEINLIEDEGQREATPTIGYYAMFEYLNGFRKAMYWNREKMEKYAKKHTKSYSSFWGKDFDGMAYKTMIRQLISKWGIMSIELRTALEGDEAVINNDGTTQFINTTTEVNESLPNTQQEQETIIESTVEIYEESPPFNWQAQEAVVESSAKEVKKSNLNDF